MRSLNAEFGIEDHDWLLQDGISQLHMPLVGCPPRCAWGVHNTHCEGSYPIARPRPAKRSHPMPVACRGRRPMAGKGGSAAPMASSGSGGAGPAASNQGKESPIGPNRWPGLGILSEGSWIVRRCKVGWGTTSLPPFPAPCTNFTYWASSQQ